MTLTPELAQRLAKKFTELYFSTDVDLLSFLDEQGLPQDESDAESLRLTLKERGYGRCASCGFWTLNIERVDEVYCPICHRPGV
jgi:hypothetical protein